MSITIHFKGKINSLSKIEPLVDIIKTIASELEWKYKIYDDEFSHPTSLKGITIHPHPKSEWLDIVFDSNGQLNNFFRIELENGGTKYKNGNWNFIKTQFAPIHIHIAIVKILQFIQSEYISNLEVHDEGGYWISGDLEGLDERRENLNKAMDILSKGLKTAKIPKDIHLKEKEIIDLIENTIRNTFFLKFKKPKRN